MGGCLCECEKEEEREFFFWGVCKGGEEKSERWNKLCVIFVKEIKVMSKIDTE